MKALVVGGTGPTGPFIVDGLRKRGYSVAIFHRGTHEIAEIPPDVEHIHGDPHFLETIEESLHGRSFDLAIVTYGRIRFIAEALAGRVGRFISVGGVASYRGYLEPRSLQPAGMSTPVCEEAPLVRSAEEHRFSHLIVQTEEAVFERHPGAAHFRYPYVYGPRQLVPREWSIIRRLVDRRPHMILADDGLSLSTHGYTENLAHSVLLAVDQPEAASGQIYNCGDEEQFSLRQIVEIIAQKLARDVEIISMPYRLAAPARPLYAGLSTHHRVMDIRKIQAQLGYQDIVPPREALGRTVDWLLANRPQPGGDLEQRLQDPFDYAGEDRLIDAWREAVDRVSEIPFTIATDVPHPYAHPKKPGERDHRNR